jgi:DUF1680 family protein
MDNSAATHHGGIMQLSRRRFLATSAAAAAGASVSKHIQALAETTAPLVQFDYADVQLLDGPMLQQFETNHAFFLAMDEDRLLKPYRERAGLPAPGEDMGGWYDNNPTYDYQHNNARGFAPGHSFGQYVSALARAYAITGDRQTQAKVQRLMHAYAATISDSFYEDFRFPAYTYDKLVCGLIDAHQFAGVQDAFAILDKTTDTALRHLPEKALSREQACERPHKNISYCWDESYTLPENLFLAYTRGAGSRYRELGARYLEDDTYFNPLAAGENVLPEQHAYSHVNALSSAMQAYLVMGSEKHLRAAKNAFQMIESGQSFATGGWGPEEAFWKPGTGALAASLNKTHSSFETPCGSYAHFKITRYLLRVTRDSRYGDSMERVLYNTVLGAKPLLEDGSSFYYSDYNKEAQKGYHPDKWPCCSGTFPQITADYGISSYLRDANNIYVNLYVPSRLMWMQAQTRCMLTQETQYPWSSETAMTLSLQRPETFGIALRIPAWAGAKTRISINGQPADVEPQPGSFAMLRRSWRNGDRIEVEFDMPMRLEAVDDQNPDLVALLHGPVALFAIRDTSYESALTRADLLKARAVSGGNEWRIPLAAGELRMKPFVAIQTEGYSLYQRIQA